jgi:hypothetical protein
MLDGGLDRTLVLYRLPEDGGTLARGEFSELLNGLGRYAAAADHALVASVQRLSTLVEALIERDPSFEFSTVVSAVASGTLYPETRAYLADGFLYRDLYYLASAVWSEGNRQSATAIWDVLVQFPDAGTYADRARAQLSDPRPEPLLVPPR